VAFEIYAGPAALGLVAIGVIAGSLLRRRRRRREMAAAVRRYDHRLAELAQTLDETLARTRHTAVDDGLPAPAPPAPPTPQPQDDAEDGDGIVLRTLELARDRTRAHAAVAAVGDREDAPVLVTVGLSRAEAAQVERMGLPDYRGARAVQVSFTAEGDTTPSREPIRAGLVVPLLDSPRRPGMLAVLTRSPARRFSEADINELERVVVGARPQLESTLSTPQDDSAPPAADEWDRRSFHALVEQEIAAAHRDGYAVALLMLDVDRLGALNARIGHDAADEALARAGTYLREVAGRSDLVCELGGGRFAVLLPRGAVVDGQRLFERARSALSELPTPEADMSSISGGVSELLADDDAAGLIGRADAALGRARAAGGGSVVTSPAHDY
jgi:diguanylate cyclase (GGDEF)-like protein